MQFRNLLLSLLALIFLLPMGLQAQKKAKTVTEGKYSYEIVPGDPLKARIYTLENGLTVYMTVNKAEPRIQTFIGVKAGSKNDPADATGLAHYLEHMLFKGTDQFGTLDFEKEQKLLTKIEQLYEQYRKLDDPAARKKMYEQIDEVSGEAAKYAIANEYDKMLAAIGASGTNAFTSFEQTAYVNDIPANQMEKWLIIEAERFRNPQMRLFHTELEAVYEEKNRSLDSDYRAMYTSLFESLFPTHNYGTQTTIGTIDHLKNPSITKIRNYYNAYYVPNNMVICLSGDLEPAKTIELIDEHFGGFKPKEVKPYTFKPEAPIQGPVRKEVVGPNAEQILIGYRFPGQNEREAKVLELIDYMLSNSSAGLIDLNLKQKQKVLEAYSTTWNLNDYSMHMLVGMPREGQELKEVENLLLDQLELIKKGEFGEDLMEAVITNMEIQQIKQYQSNRGRASAFLYSFTANQPWADQVNYFQTLRSISKKEVMEVANKYYGDNYVVVYKKLGERDAEKVEKPAITPVEVNRDAQSPFLKEVIAMESPEIAPRFLDFAGDIQQFQLKNGLPVYYLKNEENDLFYLYYVLDMGRHHDQRLPLAFDYLEYLGTNKYTPDQIQKKMYNLGMSFNVYSSRERSYVSLNGLKSKFKDGLMLFEHLLANCEPNEEALQALIQDELKAREDAKKDKNVILRRGLFNYGKYGPVNPFNDQMSKKQLEKLTGQELVDILHSLTTLEHRILYYGPEETNDLKETLQRHHNLVEIPTKISAPRQYPIAPTNQGVVYFVDYDMVQAEIMWLSKSDPWDPEMVPTVEAFNEYYGGNMSSIVFQTIRESKALAYSTYANYQTPSREEDPFYLTAYVGTQADKIHEAIAGMNELLMQMPQSDNLYQGSIASIRNRMASERIVRTGVLFEYEKARDLGLERDIREQVYERIENISFNDLRNFHATHVSDATFTLLVMGSREKIDLQSLEKYGKVQELTLEQLFGY